MSIPGMKLLQKSQQCHIAALKYYNNIRLHLLSYFYQQAFKVTDSSQRTGSGN